MIAEQLRKLLNDRIIFRKNLGFELIQGIFDLGRERAQRNAERSRSETRDRIGRAAEENQNANRRTMREDQTSTRTEGRANTRTNGVSQNRAAATNTLRTAGGHTVTAQQQATIRNSVLHGRNVPRARDVHFDVRRGTFVPNTVNFVRVSAYPELIDVFPYYRDDSFFVTEDEIVFIGPDRRIVDVVPIGAGGAEAYASADVHTFRGHDFCFYFDGWNGPGWYRCGWASRSGLGWGGVYGWNDWYYAPAFARFGRSFHGGRDLGHERRYGNEFRGRTGPRESTGIAPREGRSGSEFRGPGERTGEFDRGRQGTRETSGAGPQENFRERPIRSNRGPGGPDESTMPQAGPTTGAAPGGGGGGERGERGGRDR